MPRKRRTDEELLAATKAKAERQAARIAAKSAKTNPLLAPLADARDYLNKKIATLTRGFSIGPQSYESRIAQHELWIAEIRASAKFAEIDLEHLRKNRDMVNAAIDRFSTEIANGKVPSKQEIDDAMTLNVSDDWIDAREYYRAAQEARKSTDPGLVNEEGAS